MNDNPDIPFFKISFEEAKKVSCDGCKCREREREREREKERADVLFSVHDKSK